nr:MAG TPA: tail collar fiber protein [Caudoviricetes sp.]
MADNEAELTHIASDETLARIAVALEAQAGVSTWPTFLASKGEYDPQSIETWIRQGADGKLYGVEFTTGSAVAGTKVGDNAAMAKPVPWTLLKEGSDPYRGTGPFRYWLVNGYVDADGMPHVTAIQGDGMFALDGSNGDVWVLTPTLYFREYVANGVWGLWLSDAPHVEYESQPGAVLPSGKRRPFMLYAKYPMTLDADGVPRSKSGGTLKRYVSHDSLVALCKKRGEGYAAFNSTDDWYMKATFLVKYATKDMQTVFAGCSGHTEQTPVTVAATGKAQVTIKKSVGDLWPVGSAVMVGTTTTDSPDRGSTASHDLCEGANILSKATDGYNVTLTLDCAPFDSAVGQIVSTCPWNPGACDALGGDGSPTSCTSGREPWCVQGIERGHGAYEAMGNVLLYSEGEGWLVYVNPDSANEKAAALAEGAKLAGGFPGPATEGWNYGTHAKTSCGLMLNQGTGATTTTGLADGNYKVADTATGLREWLSVGRLGYWGLFGPFCVGGYDGTGDAGWYICSRLSANGRSFGGEAAA